MAETLLQKAQRLGIQPPKPEVGVLEETAGDIKETFSGVGQQFLSAGEKIVETATDEDLSIGGKIRGIGSAAFRGGSRAFGEAIIGAGKAVLPQRAEEAISRGVGRVGEAIAGTDIVQSLTEKYKALSPDSKREVDNALGFAEGLGEIITFGGIKRLSKPVLSKLDNAVSSVFKRSKISSKTAQGATPHKVKELYQGMNPGQRQSAIKTLSDTYQKSFVDDRPSISNKLEKEAKKQTRKGKLVDSTKLLNDLAEDTRAGVLPYVDGKLVKFDTVILNLEKRQDSLAHSLDPFLVTIKDKTKLSNLRNLAAVSLKNSRQIKGAGELSKSLGELDKFVNSLKQAYGDTLSAQDLSDIRIGMNKRSRSFSQDVFKQDSAFAIADASRNRIDQITPEGIVRKVNGEWGRLEDIKRTASILHNQTVDVGVLGGQLGRYLGVLGLSSAGFGAGGAGGLVTAGIAAHFGGEAIAQLLRNRKFGNRIKAEIIDVIRRDEVLIRQLIEETQGANKRFLEQLLLPPPKTIIGQEFKGGVSGIDKTRVAEFTAQIEAQATRAGKQRVLAEQAKKFKSRKVFINTANNNPNWLKKFEEAGTTPESVADIAGLKEVTKAKTK